nr:peptidase C48, SUMO/sentrin/Ubl1 [Tanacetum cinerariifolium]
MVDFEKGSEKNKRINKQKNNSVLKGRATVRQLFEALHGLSSERKKVIREMGFGDLIEFLMFEIPNKFAFYAIDILNTTNMTLECPMGDIVITSKIVKQVLGLPIRRMRLEREGQREYNDPFLLQWKDQFKNVNKLTIKALSDVIIETKNSDYMYRMNILTLIANTLGSCENSSSVNFIILKNVFEGDDVSDIDWCLYIIECATDEGDFKEPEMLEYLSLSSSESDDDNDDGSQLADVNEERYRKERHSNDKDDVEIVAEVQKDERNKTHYTAECSKNKDEQETKTSKKDEANNNKEEGMANTKAKNQKIARELRKTEETRTKTLLNKKDQTDDVDWESILENEEEIIRKGREFSVEQRKKAQQQEQERQRKGKKENDQIGSSSQDSPVFGIDNSLLGSQPTFDLGASPAYEKMKILSEKKKKLGLKSKYVDKTVDPAVELAEDEKLLGRSIFSTQEEEEEVVFNDDERTVLFRMNIQSLAPGLEIDTSAFFPIIAHGHYYLIVFNLKTAKPVIIDNSESDATYEEKYKDNVEFVRSVFGRHLFMYQNTNADKILTRSKKAPILKNETEDNKRKNRLWFVYDHAYGALRRINCSTMENRLAA